MRIVLSALAVREIVCKSLINKIDVPGFPFRWTLNPYRGCRHACRYCYARPTHEYLNLDSGYDFDQQIFAKVNSPQVLRQELLKPKWIGEPIIIGTASDPYEPAEGRFRLTRKILKVLAEFRNPAAITTKGVLVRRDLDVLISFNEEADVRVSFSIGTVDENICRIMEPGAPSPKARMAAMEYLSANGISAGIMVAPLLPGLSDRPGKIDDLMKMASEHGAKHISANVLFLKPGAKEWFMPFLQGNYANLANGYDRLYSNGYAPDHYTSKVLNVVDGARRRYGLSLAGPMTEMKGAQGRLF